MANLEYLQPNTFVMTDEELGLTPASRYAQLRHEQKLNLQLVKRKIRARR